MIGPSTATDRARKSNNKKKKKCHASNNPVKVNKAARRSCVPYNRPAIPRRIIEKGGE